MEEDIMNIKSSPLSEGGLCVGEDRCVPIIILQDEVKGLELELVTLRGEKDAEIVSLREELSTYKGYG